MGGVLEGGEDEELGDAGAGGEGGWVEGGGRGKGEGLEGGLVVVVVAFGRGGRRVGLVSYEAVGRRVAG